MKTQFYINKNHIDFYLNETHTIATDYFKNEEEALQAWKFYYPDRKMNELELFINGESIDLKTFNFKTVENLKSDLDGYSKKQQLDALCDGVFLADYAVTEHELQSLYHEIESDF